MANLSRHMKKRSFQLQKLCTVMVQEQALEGWARKTHAAKAEVGAAACERCPWASSGGETSRPDSFRFRTSGNWSVLCWPELALEYGGVGADIANAGQCG